eukprot:736162-Amphidinium_carterae.1
MLSFSVSLQGFPAPLQRVVSQGRPTSLDLCMHEGAGLGHLAYLPTTAATWISGEVTYGLLACMDDMLILAPTVAQAENMLLLIRSALQQAGLQSNEDKSAWTANDQIEQVCRYDARTSHASLLRSICQYYEGTSTSLASP